VTINCFCQTDVGLRRDQNQDSFLFDESIGIYMVADGMGGHRGGEVASALAVQTVREFILMSREQNRRYGPRELLVRGYEEASARIFDKSHNENPELQGMGTTLVSALRLDTTLYFANVGDSRAYLFAQDRLFQLTEDHSLINEQLRAGLITEEDVTRLTHRNVITRSVGFEREVQVDVLERPVQAGDLYLMCSDGLCGLIDDNLMATILRKHRGANGRFDLEKIVQESIDEAKKAGGDDNVTVMVISIEA
jgi:serine/threonine protein phosphatase PrpC